jgi:hypothetical protein
MISLSHTHRLLPSTTTSLLEPRCTYPWKPKTMSRIHLFSLKVSPPQVFHCKNEKWATIEIYCWAIRKMKPDNMFMHVHSKIPECPFLSEDRSTTQLLPSSHWLPGSSEPNVKASSIYVAHSYLPWILNLCSYIYIALFHVCLVF